MVHVGDDAADLREGYANAIRVSRLRVWICKEANELGLARSLDARDSKFTVRNRVRFRENCQTIWSIASFENLGRDSKWDLRTASNSLVAYSVSGRVWFLPRTN